MCDLFQRDLYVVHVSLFSAVAKLQDGKYAKFSIDC